MTDQPSRHVSNLSIDAQRLWDTLMETAEIGKTAKGGIKRLTLTDLDRQVRDWLVRQAEAGGCSVANDQMGNIFATRPGRNNDLPAVACGSHLDTQPTGGKFDGILGVLAGLELIRTLNDVGFETEAPVMVVNWTNEEGSRFAPAMVSSGVYAGAFDLDYAYGRTDKDGVTLGDALMEIGYRGDVPVGNQPIESFFELHIEQGPILEAEEKTIGVVTGAQGTRWYDVSIVGRESHAGTTPMDLRRDALMAASELMLAVERAALDHSPFGVGTVGEIEIAEPSRNVVPGTVQLTVDMRHPNGDALGAMDKALFDAAADIGSQRSIAISVEEIWYSPPLEFEADCVSLVRAAAERLGSGYRDIISGAGHDACYMSRVVPTAMVFVPCKDGISHNEIEHAEFDHCAAGANVLLQAVLARANPSIAA
jgi:N-carbamoyl-L-amino-acid hydrolase